MKKNKLLALSLLACTLLAGCEEGTKVQNGDKPIGNVQVGSDVTLDTNLTLQNFYESLKTIFDPSGIYFIARCTMDQASPVAQQ